MVEKIKIAYRHFLDWIVFSCLFIAACAWALTVSTEAFLGIDTPFFTPLHLAITGGVLVIYTLHYLTKKNSGQPSDRALWTRHHLYVHYIMLVLGLICLAVALLHLPLRIMAWGFLVALLSVAYSFPVIKFVKGKKLREFGLLKLFLLSSIWTIVTAVFPIVYYNFELQYFLFEITIRFVLLFLLCLMFDIRDMQVDARYHINTLPNAMGMTFSIQLIRFSLGLFVAMVIAQFYRFAHISKLLAGLTSAWAMWAVLPYLKNQLSEKFYLLYIDGIMLLYATVSLVPV